MLVALAGHLIESTFILVLYLAFWLIALLNLNQGVFDILTGIKV